MKKSIRLLSVLMAMVLCFTVLSTGVSAAYTDYSCPAGYDALEHPYVSAEQVGSALVDKLDEILKEKDMHGKIEVIGISLGSYDLRSIDAARNTVVTLLDSSLWSTAKSLADLGDYEKIDFSAIRSLPSRTAANRTDLEIVYGALKFLYDNAERIGKLVDGKWDDGVVSYGLKLNDELGDLHARIKEIIFDALFKDADPAPKCTATSTLDTMVNEFLYDKLIRNGSFLPSLEAEMVKGGYMKGTGIANFNLNTISVYDLLRCVLRAALTDYVKPLLLDALSGNDEILPLVTGLLEMDIPEVDPATGAAFTSEGMVNYIVNDLLDLRNGTLSKYVTVTDTGIKLTTNFETLMNELIDTAQGMMTGLTSYDTVEKWSEEEVLGLTQPQTLAYLVRTLLTSMVDYAVIPLTMPVRTNGVLTYEPVNGYAVATYMLINVMADKMPEKNYMQMIDNYAKGIGTPDQQLNPGSTGEVVTNSSGTVISYEEPAAFTVLADYMYYYLNGKTTMNVPADLSFDETLQFIVNWIIRNWGGLFRTNNLNLSATPNLQNMLVWKNLDILLWENVFDITWLPDSYVTLLKDSKGDYTGSVTRTLLLDNLLYTVVNLDFSALNNILKMFNKYEGKISGYPATGEFDMDVIQFVLTLIKRLLNGMFQSDNALFNNMQVTTLEDIVKNVEIGSTGKTNLRLLVENLSTLLSTKTTDPFDNAIKTYAERILRSALPLAADSFTKNEQTAQNFDVFPMNGETYTINDLRAIVAENIQKSGLSESMLDDDNYVFFGSEDFRPLYKYYNYRTALREAKRFLENYDWETERIADPDDELKAYTHTQEELNAIAYRIGYYLGRTALRDGDITQLQYEINNAKNLFGSGDYDDPEPSLSGKYDASNFTKKTWTAYSEALAFAESVRREFMLNGSGTVRQSKISAAREWLILAEKSLKFFSSSADYTYLNRLISLAYAKIQAAAADSGLFDASYLQELIAAYQEAVAVDPGYDGDDQNIIDEAAMLLEEIVNAPIYLPQIAKVDGKKTVLDKIHGLIYGVAEKLSDYDAYIMALGNGSIRYTYTANGSGTGTEAYLYLNNNKVQSYTVVVFGDVDGDARADATDANIVLARSTNSLTLSAYAEFAADANDDGEITTLDAYYLRRSGLGKYTVDQRGVA